MEFNQPKGIYQQIADQLRDRIIAGEWKAGDRIPSVREMAAAVGVNPNTVTRTYQTLTDDGIIENRRGIGFFVTEESQELIMRKLKKTFIEEELPRVFSMMHRLGVEIDELVSWYQKSERRQLNEEK